MVERRRNRGGGASRPPFAYLVVVGLYVLAFAAVLVAIFIAGARLVHGTSPPALSDREIYLIVALGALLVVVAALQIYTVLGVARGTQSSSHRLERFVAEIAAGTTSQRVAFRAEDGLDDLAVKLNRIAEAHHRELGLVRTQLALAIGRLTEQRSDVASTADDASEDDPLAELDRVLGELERQVVSREQ